MVTSKILGSLCTGCWQRDLDILWAWESPQSPDHRSSICQSCSSCWSRTPDTRSAHCSPSRQSRSCGSDGCRVGSGRVSGRCGCPPCRPDSWTVRLSPHTCGHPGDGWADTCHTGHSGNSWRDLQPKQRK